MPDLIGPGDIIINAWENFRKHIRLYAEFVAWFLLLTVIGWAVWAATRQLIPDLITRAAVFALLAIPLVVIGAAIAAAMIAATADALHGKPVDMRAALSTGIHRLPSLLWVSGLSSLIFLGGFVVLVVPAFIFFVWFRFAQDYAVIDGVRGMAALRASKRLVAGRWWTTFFRIVAPLLFFYIAARFASALVYLILGAAFGDPGFFFGQVSSVDELSNAHTLVTTVVTQLVNGFTVPLLVGADLILWFDLKRTAPPSA